jgi:hypothetical protein
LEEDYPYTSGVTGDPGVACDSASHTAVSTTDVNVTGFRFATNDNANSKADFIKALLDQPLNVGIEVTDSFYEYESGIFTGDDCQVGSFYQNHAVQAVGFGSAGNIDYAIVRNEWGDTWGD